MKQPKQRIFSIFYMFLLTLVFTSMVSAVKLVSDERIARNEKIKLQRIILRVLNVTVPEKTTDQELVKLFEDRVKGIQVRDRTVYVGHGRDRDTITGYAFPVGGPGFWGPISGMVAVNPDASRITGIAFYKHTETPGLGARITEDWFTKQFKDLPLFPIKGDKRIFYLKAEGTGTADNELDAITGATGTSRAVEAFLNRELHQFLTELWGGLKGT